MTFPAKADARTNKLFRALFVIPIAFFLLFCLVFALTYYDQIKIRRETKALWETIKPEFTLTEFETAIKTARYKIYLENENGQTSAEADFAAFKDFIAGNNRKAVFVFEFSAINLKFGWTVCSFEVKFASPGKIAAISEIREKNYDISMAPLKE